MNRKPNTSTLAAELRRRAEAGLWKRRKDQRSKARDAKSKADPQRLLHELQVHQIELELQNAELQAARDRVESLLENYTDLYDFAPVGYLSIDESGAILEANLTSAVMLGVDRSRLINRRALLFVSPASRPIFLEFLKKAFTGPTGETCEVLLLKEGVQAFWAGFRATPALSRKGAGKWCRVAFGDISARKQVEEAQRRVNTLAGANRELTGEIRRRQAVEDALKQSEHQSRQLLEQSRCLQEQLRLLSHQLLTAQEEERKKISRELHDVIAQTLTGINLRLTALRKEASLSTKGLDRKIARTQKLVQQSVEIVHRFAQELRPPVLDDLGLIPALHTYLKGFKQETGIHVSLAAFAQVERLHGDGRTVLYRVAQEALTNVARHARASKAEVRIQMLDGAICMRIQDNGQGFEDEHVARTKKDKRLGLIGMRERLEMIGGGFTVTSARGKGTSVLVRIPLADAARAGGGGRGGAR